MSETVIGIKSTMGKIHLYKETTLGGTKMYVPMRK